MSRPHLPSNERQSRQIQTYLPASVAEQLRFEAKRRRMPTSVLVREYITFGLPAGGLHDNPLDSQCRPSANGPNNSGDGGATPDASVGEVGDGRQPAPVEPGSAGVGPRGVAATRGVSGFGDSFPYPAGSKCEAPKTASEACGWGCPSLSTSDPPKAPQRGANAPESGS